MTLGHREASAGHGDPDRPSAPHSRAWTSVHPADARVQVSPVACAPGRGTELSRQVEKGTSPGPAPTPCTGLACPTAQRSPGQELGGALPSPHSSLRWDRLPSPPSVRRGPRVQPTPQDPPRAEHGVPGFCSLCFAGNCVERGPTGPTPIKGSGRISSPGHCPHCGPRPVSCLSLQLCSWPPARGGFPRASPTVPSTPRLCTCTSALHRAPQHCTPTPQMHANSAVRPVTEHPNSAHYAPTPQNAPSSAQCTPTLHGAPQLHRAYYNPQSTHGAAHPTGLQRKKVQVWGLFTQGSVPEAAAWDRPAAWPARHGSEPQPGLAVESLRESLSLLELSFPLWDGGRGPGGPHTPSERTGTAGGHHAWSSPGLRGSGLLYLKPPTAPSR